MKINTGEGLYATARWCAEEYPVSSGDDAGEQLASLVVETYDRAGEHEDAPRAALVVFALLAAENLILQGERCPHGEHSFQRCDRCWDSQDDGEWGWAPSQGDREDFHSDG